MTAPHGVLDREGASHGCRTSVRAPPCFFGQEPWQNLARCSRNPGHPRRRRAIPNREYCAPTWLTECFSQARPLEPVLLLRFPYVINQPRSRLRRLGAPPLVRSRRCKVALESSHEGPGSSESSSRGLYDTCG